MKKLDTIPGYKLAGTGIITSDTISKTGIVTSGWLFWLPPSPTDTNFSCSFLQKTTLNGASEWFRSYYLDGKAVKIKHHIVLRNRDLLIGGTAKEGDGIIMRADSSGNVKWVRVYKGNEVYRLLRMKNDNIAVLSIEDNKFPWFTKHAKLALLDTSGSEIWCKKYTQTDSTSYIGMSLLEADHNKLFILYANSGILVDSTGKLLSDIHINSPQSNMFTQAKYFGNGFYLTGTSFNTFSNKWVGRIIRLDNSLNVVFDKLFFAQFGGTSFMDIEVAGNNNFIVFTDYFNPDILAHKLGFCFIDSSAVIRRNYAFTSDSLNDSANNFKFLDGGKILFTGVKRSFGVTDTTAHYFCGGYTNSYSVQATNEKIEKNKYTEANSSFTYYPACSDVSVPYSARISFSCSSGPQDLVGNAIIPCRLDTGDATTIKRENFENWFTIGPNPSSGNLTVAHSALLNDMGVFTVQICNAVGTLIYRKSISGTESSFDINLEDCDEGMYVATFLSEKGSFRKKVIIQHK